MKKTLLLMAVVGLISAIPAISGPEPKVTICHVPPGNPDNPLTIIVGASAVPAHLANHAGDAEGACGVGGVSG